jgi:hypothetical protein
MDAQAKVTSLDALEAFRASLIRYLERGRRALDEVGGEVRRTRQWLDHDRRLFWESQHRLRAKQLAQAEQELYSARLSGLHDSNNFHQMAVQKARRRLEEAETKLRVLKQWRRAFDSRVEPLAKRLDGLQQIYALDLPRAVVALGETLKILEDYAGVRQPAAAPAPASGDAAPAAPAGEEAAP